MFKAYKAVLRDNKGIYTNGCDSVHNCYWKKNKHYKINGDLKLCKHGIHYFRHLCFAIDYLKDGNEIWEVEIHGNIKEDTFKGCTNDIVFIRKKSKREIKRMIKKNKNSGSCNAGDYNSGNYNSGDHNSGNYNGGNYNSGNYNSRNYNSGDHNSRDHNSGNYNSGYCNSGNYNSGDHNSGDYNSGDYNSGDYNSGDYNSGYCNSGNYNSGDHNSGDYNSGDGYINFFCTKQKYFLFDIEVETIPEKLLNIDMSWFNLKNKTYKDAWKECPDFILDILKSIPEFQTEEAKAIFKKITGLDL